MPTRGFQSDGGALLLELNTPNIVTYSRRGRPAWSAWKDGGWHHTHGLPHHIAALVTLLRLHFDMAFDYSLSGFGQCASQSLTHTAPHFAFKFIIPQYFVEALSFVCLASSRRGERAGPRRRAKSTRSTEGNKSKTAKERPCAGTALPLTDPRRETRCVFLRERARSAKHTT